MRLPNRLQWLHRLNKRNISLIYVFAFQGGTMNVCGFLFANKFVTHMTGFATMFGYKVATAQAWPALGMIVVPMFYLAGSFLSALLIDRELAQKKQPHIRTVLLVMLGTLLTVFIMALFAPHEAQTTTDSFWSFIVANQLAFASGLQNGTTTSIFIQNIRTTHLTGPTTDLGIGLARLAHPFESQFKFSELILCTLRFGIIGSFILGSICASFAFFSHHPLRALIIPVIITSLLLISSYHKLSPIFSINSPLGILNDRT